MFKKLYFAICLLLLQASLVHAGNDKSFSTSELVTLGKLVNLAYDVFDAEPENSNPSFPQPFLEGYTPIANVLAKDAINSPQELYGHVIQVEGEKSSWIISVRGTSDFKEWVADIEFMLTPYNPDTNAGKVENGFGHVYLSFQAIEPGASESLDLVSFLKTKDIERLTVVGHSLGSSLSTLLSYRLAYEGIAPRVEAVTFASPRTGNADFVNAYEGKISKHIRVVNKPDWVPRVPPKLFGYSHLDNLLTVDSKQLDYIKHSLVCYHSLSTYLHLLDKSVPVEEKCKGN